MAAISIQDLTVVFRRGSYSSEALHEVSFSVEEGSILGIIGPSGCGKSTLLRILAGVHTDYSGRVLFKGEKPDPRRHSIALVPQHFGLLPWKHVKANILFPLVLGKTPSRTFSFSAISKALGIEGLLHRYPSELSGGQQQRVALARAFIQTPELLLLDEPFSALDVAAAERCRGFLLESLKKDPHAPTTILVSHNLEEVEGLCDEVILMQEKPGRIKKKLQNFSVKELEQQLKDA